MADENGWIFWYNKRWFDYTGTTLEEMEGWGWQKVHHPDHVQRVVDKISYCFKTGEVWEDTFPLRGKDGNYRWFLSRAMPIRDQEGKVIRWFGTNTDITERRQMEEEISRSRDELERRVQGQDRGLHESGAKLKRAQEIAHVGSWSWDMETYGQEWSDESCRIFGFEPGEVQPDYDLFMGLVHPDDRERLAKLAGDCVEAPITLQGGLLHPPS